MKKIISIILAAIILTGCVSVGVYDDQGKKTQEIKAYIPYQYNLKDQTISINEKTAELMATTTLKAIEIGGTKVAEQIADKAIQAQKVD